MSSRQVVLEPRIYHATFLNSFLSEIRKMAYLRGFWVQAIGVVALYGLIMFAVGVSQKDYGPSYLDAQAITFGITFLVIFTFAMGGSAVTNEYSSNTMRTTALSDPNRLRSYTAKHVGVFVMVGGVSLVLTLVAILAYMVGAGGSWDFGDGNLRALVMFWLILTTSATMATSLGYIIRSTAGTITASMALLYVSNAIVIINIDWIRETLYNYLPLQVIQGATVSNLDLMGMDMKLSWSTSIIVWLGYALVFWVLGFVRYQRSDI